MTFKFRRPNGSELQQPGLAMRDALQRLTETTEMQPLLAQATKSGTSVAFEVLQSRDGQPLLIHIKREAA